MIYPIRTIVVGIGSLDDAAPILACAARLAKSTGAAVHFIHAYEFPPLLGSGAAMGAADAQFFQAYAYGVQTRLEAAVRAETQLQSVSCRAVPGSPAEVIDEAAQREKADLVMIGANNRGLLSRFLGSTAQRVLRQSQVPVLVLNGPLRKHLKRVLLPTDLSEFNSVIHEIGLDVLESLFPDERPKVRSLHVLWESFDLPTRLPIQSLDDNNREAFLRFLKERRERPYEVEGIARCGDAPGAIAEESAAWNADLLVLGTHGRRGFKRWVLGSVAEAAIREADLPTLVIPAPMEEQRILPVPVTTAGHQVVPLIGSSQTTSPRLAS